MQVKRDERHVPEGAESACCFNDDISPKNATRDNAYNHLHLIIANQYETYLVHYSIAHPDNVVVYVMINFDMECFKKNNP